MTEPLLQLKCEWTWTITSLADILLPLITTPLRQAAEPRTHVWRHVKSATPQTQRAHKKHLSIRTFISGKSYKSFQISTTQIMITLIWSHLTSSLKYSHCNRVCVNPWYPIIYFFFSYLRFETDEGLEVAVLWHSVHQIRTVLLGS